MPPAPPRRARSDAQWPESRPCTPWKYDTFNVPHEVSAYLAELIGHCASISSVWRLGLRAGSKANGAGEAAPAWDLLAFLDLRGLQQLRYAGYLHREDMRLRVVTDSDCVRSTWGEVQSFGSLCSWGWRRSNVREAYYDEVAWAEPVSDRLVRRIRRKAICLWEEAYRPARPSSGTPVARVSLF